MPSDSKFRPALDFCSFSGFFRVKICSCATSAFFSWCKREQSWDSLIQACLPAQFVFEEKVTCLRIRLVKIKISMNLRKKKILQWRLHQKKAIWQIHAPFLLRKNLVLIFLLNCWTIWSQWQTCAAPALWYPFWFLVVVVFQASENVHACH